MRELIEFINEAFASSIIRDLEKQLKEVQQDDAYYKRDFSFKNYLNAYFDDIRWNKLTDDKIEKSSGDDPKTVKRIKSALRASAKESLLVITKDKENKVFMSVILTQNRSAMYLPSGKIGWGGSRFSAQAQMKIQSISDIVERSGDVYIIDMTDEDIYIDPKAKDSRSSRIFARQGMIKQGDAEFYKEIAYNNIERYKKIIKQKSADKLPDQDMVDNIKDTLEQAYDAMEEIVANPSVDGTYRYNVEYFIDYTCKALEAFKKYADAKRNTKQGYTFYDPKKKLQEFNDICAKMQSYLAKIS